MGCIEIWCPKCNKVWLIIDDIKDVHLRAYKECSKCRVNVKEE